MARAFRTFTRTSKCLVRHHLFEHLAIHDLLTPLMLPVPPLLLSTQTHSIILGEDGAVDTVIVDYRYMDKTFPVKADGMVDIDNKEFDERKDPDNTHYGSMANRLPPWRESEATELTYSRLVCCEFSFCCVLCSLF